MAYNIKTLKKDLPGGSIPQYFNPETDDFEPLYGKANANRVLLYDANGNPLLTAVNPGVIQGAAAHDAAASGSPVQVGGVYRSTDPAVTDGDAASLRVNAKGELLAQLAGSIETVNSAPVTGVKTVTATAAELFAGASVKANRRKLIVKNEDTVLRFRIGPSTVTQQTGFPVEPGAAVEIQFDPATAVPVYAISGGASLSVAVMEI